MARKPKTPPTVVGCSLQPYRSDKRYKVMFSDGSHRFLKRTTQILDYLAKPSLPKWSSMQTANYYEECLACGLHPNYWQAVNAGDRARDASGTRGTEVHNAIEAYLRHGVVWDHADFSPEQLYALQSWLVWWEDSGMVASQIEVVAYSLTLGYGGTIDLVVKDGGGLRIYDWKSGELRDGYLWQLAAYAFALYEMGLGEVTHAELIGLPREIGKPLKVNVAWNRDRLDRRQVLMTGWNAFCIACNTLPELEDSIEQDPLVVPYVAQASAASANWGQEPLSETEIEELFTFK